jgi:hypothetical protein
MTGFQAAILMVALGIYVLATKNFHPRSFLIALNPALLVLTLVNTAVTSSQVLPWSRLFLYYVLWRLPLFFALLISISRLADANEARTKTPSIVGCGVIKP